MTNSENRIKMKTCLVNKDEEADVEEEWQIFEGCVEKCYQDAYKEALELKWRQGRRKDHDGADGHEDQKRRRGRP